MTDESEAATPAGTPRTGGNNQSVLSRVLKLRYESAKKNLEHRIAKAKADAASTTNDEVDNLQDRLKELESSAQDNWDKMTEGAAKKVNDLLDRFETKKAS